jgi:hypothetical protein
MLRQIALVTAVVLLIRLPFLNQAIQGDDVYYLAGAQHAQIDPLHPNHAHYVFLGTEVSMQGHPHPPLNVWCLAGLLALAGDIREVPFHAAYILFSLIAALAMLSLARRFSTRPLVATLLFLSVAAFVVNGNSLEADLPFLAFWMAAVALFVLAVDSRSLWWLSSAKVAMALAALAAYQAVLLLPILAVYLWTKRRSWWQGWAVLAVVPVVLGAWQLFERASTGALPASVLAGYLQTYGLQRLAAKALNAVALTGHAGWLIFPLLAVAAFGSVKRLWWIVAVLAAFRDPNPLFWGSIGVGVLVVTWCASHVWKERDADTRFLAAWALLFFAGALMLFFAGSARYLLPMAAPVALLAVRSLNARPAWLAAGVGLQMALSLGFSVVNYQHWDGYRQFARSLRTETATRRTWINGEWGLRYYFESDGGLPLLLGQAVRPGDMVVSSDLAFPIQFATGGEALVPLADREIRASLPLRLSGLGARSAYSSDSSGLRPFDLSFGPIDRVHAAVVVERRPVLSYLPLNAPEAEQQIVSGLFQVEEGGWRWMAGRAVILLKRPEQRSIVQVALHIPEQSPARRISLSLDGVPVAEQTFPAPGTYTLSSGPVTVASQEATLTITADKTFSVPGDERRLSIILTAAGFRPAP